MSTSARRIDLTVAGHEGYFFTRSNPHASPPARSTFLPFSSQSPAKTSPGLGPGVNPGLSMRRGIPPFVRPTITDPIARPGNSHSKAFELVDDIEDISATQWEAEASKSSKTGSSQAGAGGPSRPARYSSPDTAQTSARPSRSGRSTRKADRRGVSGDDAQSSSPTSASTHRKRKRGSISISAHEAIPNSSPVPRLDQTRPGSSSATSYAQPKTPNIAPSNEAYEWSPSPTPVPRAAKEAVRLEDLFSSPPRPDGKIQPSGEIRPDNEDDFGDGGWDDVLGAASPALLMTFPAVVLKGRSDTGPRPRPIIFDDEPPPVDVEDEIFDDMAEPDSFDEYDLPLDTDLADIDLMDIPALAAGSASGSGPGSVSSQSRNAGSGTGTPVGGRPTATHSNLHRALFGADDGGNAPHRPKVAEQGNTATPRSGHNAALPPVNNTNSDDLGFSRISDLPPKWQDFYLHHWRRGVDGRKAPRVSRDSVDERSAAATSGPSRAARGKAKAAAPRARKKLVEVSDEDNEGDGDMVNVDDYDDDDDGESDADTYRDGSQDSFVDDEDDPAAQRAREKKRQAKSNEALSGTRKRGGALPGRGSRVTKVSSAARSIALTSGAAIGLGPQEPKGRAAGGGGKRGGWGGKRGFRGGRGGWRGAARGRR